MVDIYDLEVNCPSCEEITSITKSKHRRGNAIILAFLLGLIGLGAGSTIGIATAGLGATAILPLTAIGIYSGVKLGQWYTAKRHGVRCEKCDYNFESGFIRSAIQYIPSRDSNSEENEDLKEKVNQLENEVERLKE